MLLCKTQSLEIFLNESSISFIKRILPLCICQLKVIEEIQDFKVFMRRILKRKEMGSQSKIATSFQRMASLWRSKNGHFLMHETH